jgi:spore maturation protein CgeB
LIKALAARGHKITFLECEAPWYRENRDLHDPAYCRVELYESLREIPRRFGSLVADADLVVLGSYVPGGAVLGDWVTTHTRGVTAFYDIDTPVTLAGLDSGAIDYIAPAMVPRFDLYLSFTGGPALRLIEDAYGSPRARALYCAVDPELHAPLDRPLTWSLGYLGTYSESRQPALQQLLIEPARRLPDQAFVVAGAQYPVGIDWPDNVERIEHLPPNRHAEFYCSQRYTLNLTRAEMIEAGFSPSVRLFEAAACGVPIISDRWAGIETFFTPGREILIAESPEQAVHFLSELPEERRQAIAAAARRRVLREHTAEHRAKQLEDYYREAAAGQSRKVREAVA